MMKKFAKIENEETKVVSVGTGTDIEFYKAVGMTEMEVEQGYNGSWYLQGYAPEKPQELIEAEALAKAKQERASEVDRLTVEVEGMVFDADETSQARMSVAASSMTDDETNVWVLHDNSVVQVTKAQLLQACRLARIAQSAVWTKPYEAS